MKSALPLFDPTEPAHPRNHWYTVLDSSSLGREPVALRRFGRDWVAFRDGEGRARLLPKSCPHRGADLAQGRVVDGELECPYHGFRFDGAGRCTRVPCNGRDARVPKGLDTDPIPVREEHGFLWVYDGDRPHPDDVPWLPEASDDLRYTVTRGYEWNVCLERVVEGFMDLHHVAFAHRYWAPTGPIVDPFDVELDGDLIRVRGKLAWEKSRRGFDFRFDVRFPGTMFFEFGKGTWAAIGMCPIDDEHTWFAIRYHQDWIRLPGIGTAFSWLLMQYERQLILPDDRRLLETTEPKHAKVGTNKLVKADEAIALWHKLAARDAREASRAVA